MYCRNCGKELAKSAAFCTHCGAAQKKAVQPEPASSNTSENQTINRQESTTWTTPRIIQVIIATIAVTAVYFLLRKVIIVVAAGVFAFVFSVFNPDPTARSVASLKQMTCEEFLSLNQSQRFIIIDKLFTAKHNEVSSIGSGFSEYGAEYECNNNPFMILGEINL